MICCKSNEMNGCNLERKCATASSVPQQIAHFRSKLRPPVSFLLLGTVTFVIAKIIWKHTFQLRKKPKKNKFQLPLWKMKGLIKMVRYQQMLLAHRIPCYCRYQTLCMLILQRYTISCVLVNQDNKTNFIIIYSNVSNMI